MSHVFTSLAVKLFLLTNIHEKPEDENHLPAFVNSAS